MSKLVDDLIEPEEMRELEGILENSADARGYYRDYIATHLELTESQPVNPAALVDFEAARPRSRYKPLLAAAALVSLAGVPLVWWASRNVDSAVPDVAGGTSPASALPVLGVTSRLEGVSWNLAAPPISGTRIGPGPVELESGKVQLDMVGGQSVTIGAPARFELVSDSEMLLSSGDVSLSNDNNKVFIVRVPGGAVVDSGTELSIKVSQDGTSDVHVFQGRAIASVTGDGDRTREERVLRPGESVQISNRLEASSTAERDFLRPFSSGEIAPTPAGARYASRVSDSQPTSWWRFESIDADGSVPDEAGGHPLLLKGTPQLRGSGGAGFLENRSEDGDGYCYGTTGSGIAGLEGTTGHTIECLLYSGTEKYATAIALELDAPEDSTMVKPVGVSHAPQRALIERTGRRGARIGHLHPDFVIRGMCRAPAAYYGGYNTYTREAYLLHRWMHVALTFDGTKMRLYLDGKISDELSADMPPSDALLRPIIGRLQSKSSNDLRPWLGGIDEVALYGRALSPEEVRAHFDALGK